MRVVSVEVRVDVMVVDVLVVVVVSGRRDSKVVGNRYPSDAGM